ncbi:L-carnitine dehydrogenase [Candidatus Pelagibacter sp. HTCC7211]|jgi:crotonobetainyl-CoA:carnitine CoA-transferase CaiB-like acyl-CoA transferase|uniref:CaiB/BaiF CoA transferase family protein n=1 Tax=Pelagibacter sp. (strain HTCC7211) TaxID=439493 RepID=UPI0001839ACA|nr:CoA transferase [Candidatus Pelagibacter sp. HTCC7211]EDZ60283.1 L-carnitine dehydrogenase [Candidatus Pelagibacter sp. HTCC7211]MBD1151634.1 CoA transferase [Pelagibacterales bacterium SAG-MED25]|tara:strand:- start:1275 stop:2468 length:1194 start_codon:yes stop_codon:yes gene_type:complete
MPASLKGIRVLEMSQIMAGPTCGLLLADLGAEVIKIEKTPGGDDTRRFLPPDINGEAAAFMMMNRNKKGIALNLKDKDGIEIFKKMVKNSDVVLENFRKGTLEKLGIGYDVISKINPKIILCEISGYGRTGPYADKGGFDLVAQGMSGLMSITGESKDKPPMKVGAPITDITAGLLATSGILAALVHRNKTGEGQKVDTSLFEAGIVHTYWQSAIAGATGESPGPLGSAHPLTAPYQAFKTKDKWITVGASNQNTWLMLLKAIDRMDLQENEMFSSNFNRKENITQLVEILNSELIKKTSKEWLKIFDENGLPCGPINSINEMFVDPQTIEREMIIDVDNKKAGKSKAIGMPIKFSKSKTEKSKGAPNLGEHTKEIMKIFDYNDKQIDDFYNRKIII